MSLDTARTGTLDARDPPLKAIVAASDVYAAGYHKGDAGGLDAIDTDLTPGNIKSGITVFGKVGSANVQDISDADLTVGEAPTGKTFYAVSGGRKTGTGTKTLSAANETVAAGYYAATTLSTVDIQLAAANILSGINIFGFVGVATVQDIADADAVLADVMSGKTFYSVTGGRKTGSLATVTIAAGSTAYPAGYHVGAANLMVIDADLVTGSIKSGVTIFGVAGSTNVRDSTDADSVAGDVKSGKTFYAGGGARKTGTLATRTLNAANETVQDGYYATTTLSTVDADLAVGNIKSGVVVFGFTGTFTNTASAPAAGDVKSGKVCWANGTQITGTMATVSLSAAANSYPAGYHIGQASLTAVDGDLVTGSIKSGVTIFGVAGHTDVRNVSDANLTVGEAPTGKTFYAVGGARKTGTGTKTLNPANETVNAGYYAATTLSTVDAQLAAANIKSGVVIFGFTGAATVQDIADANAVLADVKSGKTFYSVTGGRKTGNLATVSLSAGSNSYPAGYHAGAANLTAVDGDLVAANIADGITIFGILGTLSATLVQDILGSAKYSYGCINSGTYYMGNPMVPGGGNLDLASKTQSYTADSLAVGVAFVYSCVNVTSRVTMKLIMAGVQVAVTGWIAAFATDEYILVGTRALSGSQTCICRLSATAGGGVNLLGITYNSGEPHSGGIAIGSVKT